MPKFLLVLLLLLLPSQCLAQDAYYIDGEVKGFFCRYFGFVCNFKKVDAVSRPKEEPRPLPVGYTSVDQYKLTKDGEPRCWVNTKADESKYGWWAVLWDWWTDAPVFYAAKDDGTFDKLGTPEFIVFRCRKS